MSSTGSISGPSTSIGMPAARYAAAGAITSRPAKVGPGAASWYSADVISTTRLRPAEHRDRGREQPVVGADERGVLDLDRDAAPVGADAGVDDREHDALGQVLDRPHEREALRRARRTPGRRG